MGWVEIEPPPPGSGAYELPLWLLIPLAIMWAYFVLREPKPGKTNHGWFVPPAIISIAAFVIAAGMGL